MVSDEFSICEEDDDDFDSDVADARPD